jgi:hypothetical protein
MLVDAVALLSYDIIDLILKDPDAMYRIDPWKMEEIIAGAWERNGFEATLTRCDTRRSLLRR